MSSIHFLGTKWVGRNHLEQVFEAANCLLNDLCFDPPIQVAIHAPMNVDFVMYS